MKNLFATLGAKEKEMKAFLKMLELGPQPVSVIAKYVGVPRSSMYVIIDRLKELRLVEEFNQNGIKYVKGISVEGIYDLIRSKERALQQAESLLDTQREALEKLENRLSITPKVRFFQGRSGVKKTYDNIYKEKHFYGYFNAESMKKAIPEYYLTVGANLRKKKGTAKEIIVDNPEGHVYRDKFQSKTHQIKFFPKGVVMQGETMLCKDKIYLFMYGENDTSVTEVHNPELAETQRTIFEQLWKRL